MNPTTQQRIASVFRQILAVVALVFSVLTQAVAGIKTTPLESFVLGLFGTLILALEHYVADPSTGTPTTNVPVAAQAVVAAPVAPVAPVAAPAAPAAPTAGLSLL